MPGSSRRTSQFLDTAVWWQGKWGPCGQLTFSENPGLWEPVLFTPGGSDFLVRFAFLYLDYAECCGVHYNYLLSFFGHWLFPARQAFSLFCQPTKLLKKSGEHQLFSFGLPAAQHHVEHPFHCQGQREGEGGAEALHPCRLLPWRPSTWTRREQRLGIDHLS